MDKDSSESKASTPESGNCSSASSVMGLDKLYSSDNSANNSPSDWHVAGEAYNNDGSHQATPPVSPKIGLPNEALKANAANSLVMAGWYRKLVEGSSASVADDKLDNSLPYNLDELSCGNVVIFSPSLPPTHHKLPTPNVSTESLKELEMQAAKTTANRQRTSPIAAPNSTAKKKFSWNE